MSTLFRLLSRLPLWALHGLGLVLGWLVFLASAAYRKQFLANARHAGLAPGDIALAIGESGKQVAELPRLWLGRPVPVVWSGLQNLENIFASQQGAICLTPHLGAFEVTPQAYAERFGAVQKPITVLYRPPRKAWLQDLLDSARQRPGMVMAPTTAGGVKQLIKALRKGEFVGILPDQVPPLGQGVWVPFFGKPAYTMTLSARLVHQTGAAVLTVWTERLSWGRGYRVHVRPLDFALSPDLETAVVQINQAMEGVILQKPTQYLWSYARYKSPREGGVA